MTYTQYFSKWRNKWVYFRDNFDNKIIPNEVEIKYMKKCQYKLK